MEKTISALSRSIPVLIALLATPSLVSAQEGHSASVDELNALVGDRATSTAADRATVSEFLKRPAVRRAADNIGLEIDEVESAVQTLDGADAGLLADRIRKLDQEIQADRGGITITYIAIIIGLLVLILLILIL